MNQSQGKPLIPDILFRPVFLLWTALLPQIALLIYNLGITRIVYGNLDPAQKSRLFAVFGYEVALFVTVLALWSFLKYRRKRVNLWVCTGMIAIHVGYLWMVTGWIGEILPRSVTTWIVSPGQFMNYQYMFIIPAIFFAAIHLAAFDMNIGSGRDFGISLAVLILVPVFWFLVMQLSLSVRSGMNLPVIVMLILFMGFTILVMLAFLRVLLMIYRWLSGIKADLMILAAAAGLLAPLGGLILNISIPFPFDFQSVEVYVFTVINGLILLIPFKSGTLAGRLGWCGRSIMYPFTLYFFFVFLPYLPLSLLAMIVCGAGFLILAPTLLFVVHTKLLYDEAVVLAEKNGKLKTAVLFIALLLVLPAGFTLRAIHDKASLMKAVDYTYSGNYTDQKADINLRSVERAMTQLKKAKESIYLPFLSDYYSQLVFKGMVLPDYKIDEISRLLLGEVIKIDKGKGRNRFMAFGPRVGSRAWVRQIRPPERNVSREDVIVSNNVDGDIVRTKLRIRMKNNGGSNSEFVERLYVPRGVLVSGFALKVAHEWVPGRIFEKKTAMWVYHKIRDVVRRDPGLLVYDTPDTLTLRVYPFGSDETREVEIQLTYPHGIRPSIQMGSDRFVLGEETEWAAHPILVPAPQAVWWHIPKPVLTRLPVARRVPYFHFILDRSEGAENNYNGFRKIMRKIIAEYPEIAGVRITEANFEYRHLTDKIIPVEDVGPVWEQQDVKHLPFRGGFDPERAMKGCLIEFGEDMPLAGNGTPMVPVFVVLKAAETELVNRGSLNLFAAAVQDATYYGLMDDEGSEKIVAFNGDKLEQELDEIDASIIFKSGEEHCIMLVDQSWGTAVFSEKGTLSCLDAETGMYKDVEKPTEISGGSEYLAGTELWNQYFDVAHAPSKQNRRLSDLVKKSRETGVMIPLTSYIVVEDAAQWATLSIKEKQALRADHALEFDEFQESPEPSLFLLLIPTAYLIYRRRSKGQNQPPL